ncbi:putative transmembrane anti-sigma factor [Stanieria cyanosphaera PCC 7437]|uniref:Transmembrane anti-sigma factor n=1 Tax=Stanieria cyanosphaera (strain ATCC 29371 / PCC 7437) TaxID=111780 RepID=K9XXQ7_STAC7|nr:zf-HC2 domain-containing protein [Stanieria cyanosphaera]AFZ37385.1 putative transmembrane anti-sigma factor [Stanieria cyanosphaera PCC 7437]
MTSKFDDFESSHKFYLSDWEGENTTPDCFELLSAYLDGEVTPQERQQVQDWLDNDPKIRQIYHKLRQLHCKFESIPIPTNQQVTADLSVNVFQAIDRSQRKRRLLYWGGSAVAALFVAVISGLSSGENLGFKMANSVEKQNHESIMVAVAVNKPAVKIPKASVSSSNLTDEQ